MLAGGGSAFLAGDKRLQDLGNIEYVRLVRQARMAYYLFTSPFAGFLDTPFYRRKAMPVILDS